MQAARGVIGIVQGQPASDGAGVRLNRVIGGRALPEIDPFLLLDQFGSDDPDAYIAGFPDHPHRGFETVTYMLAGHMRHQDHLGNRGDLGPGSVQWMTAGRGIIHSEMPLQADGLMAGFQLWVNLPARDKMTAPRYQEFAADAIPAVAADGFRVKVIAGALPDGTRGPIAGVAVDPTYLDVALAPGRRWQHRLPAGHTAFAYAFEGAVAFGGRRVDAGQLALLDRDGVVAAEGGPEGGRFLLIAGRPLGEPIVRHGPFVMTTVQEIRQAIDDYQSGRF